MLNGEIIFHLNRIGTEKHTQTSGLYINMNTYILAKGWNFKTFLKENYAIALDSCYLFNKKMLNMELNMF